MQRVKAALKDDDVLLYTSRTLKRGDDDLAIAREVSRAVTDVVAAALEARPAWVIAKGGITSHDVAVRGLGIRRADVLGQLLDGMVSVFRPVEADPRAVGMPYVVFAGNVGDEQTLAEIVDRFRGLMLATGTSLLRRGQAVAAITTYTLESTVAIVRAAERLDLPVLLMAGASSYGAVGRGPLAAAALAAARAASVPVGVHLDHCRDEAEVDACLALGYSSVMIDGSHLPLEENIALTRRVVERAHAAGAWVEAELGAVAGNEDRSGQTTAGEMTDPGEAAEFAERTGVDALAVAVGNVHGFTPEPVRLDLERLARSPRPAAPRSSCTARPACRMRISSGRSPRAS